MRDAPPGRAVLKRSVTGQFRYVATASVLASGHQAGEALIPVLIGVVIDTAVGNGDLTQLLGWVAVIGAVFAALSTCYRLAARTSERASEQAAHQLRLDLSNRILDPRGGAESRHLPGALVNIATDDARRVGVVNAALPFGFAALMGIAVTAFMLLRMSVPLGLLVLFGAPPLLWLTHLVGKPLERRSGLEQERAAQASGVAADLVAGLRVLKGIGAEPSAITRYRDTSQQALGATIRSARAHAWHDGAILAFTGLFITLVALVGGHLAVGGQISVGDLVAAVGLAQFLLGPLSVFTFVNGAFAQGRASAARIADVLSASPGVTAGTQSPPETVGGQLRFSGVTHASLRDVDFDVTQGELLSVVTTSPSTAQALLECLGREVDPESGRIDFDDIDLSTMHPETVRSLLLVAHHDADLFEGSLLDNVAVPTATSQDIEAAMVTARADEVAEALPDGRNTHISERGGSLSGGQRQRVALARALAVNPPVLVLHEPTSAVDSVTESRIATALREHRRGRTTIVVTTSPALLTASDRVLVLDGDTVTAGGTHGDLLHDERYRTAVLT